MSSSNTDQSASKADCRSRDDSSANVPPPSIRDDDHDAALESWLNLCQDEDCAETRPATSSTSYKLSEGSETAILGGCRDGGAFEGASSVTLRDERTWHDGGVNKSTQKIPRAIVSALLQGVSDVSPPSRCTLDRAGREVQETGANSDAGDVLPRYSAMQKGKWKTWADDDVVDDSPSDREESPQFEFPSFHNSVGEWVIHNRPILQDYADRQVSLPLGQRLDVSIDEPSQFILGTLQLLVNRDQSNCRDHSRRLGPQLIENFVDISRWIKEYFRSRHGTHVVDTDVSTLLTIVLNNFYEGQVQLIDRLVESALGNMRLGGRSSLEMADFAFGFDFRMSQDLPFYVETGARFRKPRPIRAVEVRSLLAPVTTSSGRQVKPTKRAQESAVQTQKNGGSRRNNNDINDNKGKHAVQVAQDKPAAGVPVPAVAPEKKSLERPSADHIVLNAPQAVTAAAAAPPHKAPAGTRYRLIRPSNLKPHAVPLGASSAPGATPLQLGDNIRSRSGESAAGDAQQVPGSSGSNHKRRSPPRLKIKLLANGATTKTATATTTTAIAPATSDSETTASKKSTSAAANASGSVTPSREHQEVQSSSTCTGAHGHNTRRGRGRAHGHGHGRDRERGAGTPTSAHADNVLPTAALAGDTAEAAAVLPAAVDVPVAPPTTPTVEDTHAPLSAGTSSRRPHGAGNSIEQYLFKLRLNKADPDHPQAKKRKLDDCDD